MLEPPSESQKPKEDKKIIFSDFFGFGKIIDKLNLNKLNTRMTYCMVSALIILSFFGVMYKLKSDPNEFPTSTDMRVMSLTCVIILGAGIWDKLKTNKST